MNQPHIILREQFAQPKQQQEADTLGMWVFLGTEIMLFGGLFMSILVYRVLYSKAVAEASKHLDMWLGGLNTAVLLTSSLTMALAVLAARAGHRGAAVASLAATGALGLFFLGIKGYEYYKEYNEGLMPGVGPPFPLDQTGTELFFNLYFVSTGLHAMHLTIAVGMIAVITVSVATGRTRLPQNHMTIEIAGLYWHLVDIVWIFLYPVLYLAR